jgi:selenocysteine lyase/cysteine desulfurase
MTVPAHTSVLCFVLNGYKTEEVGVESAVRPSLGVYNTYDDLDALLCVLCKLKGISS